MILHNTADLSQERILRRQKAKEDSQRARKVTQLPQSSIYQKQQAGLQLLQQQEWEVQEELRMQSQRHKQQMHLMQMSWMMKLDDQQTRMESQLGRIDTPATKQKSAQGKLRRHRKQNDPPPSWRPVALTSTPGTTESSITSTDSLASECHGGAVFASAAGRGKATAERRLTMQHFKMPNVQPKIIEKHESLPVLRTVTPIPENKSVAVGRSTPLSAR